MNHQSFVVRLLENACQQRRVPKLNTVPPDLPQGEQRKVTSEALHKKLVIKKLVMLLLKGNIVIKIRILVASLAG